MSLEKDIHQLPDHIESTSRYFRKGTKTYVCLIVFSLFFLSQCSWLIIICIVITTFINYYNSWLRLFSARKEYSSVSKSLPQLQCPLTKASSIMALPSMDSLRLTFPQYLLAAAVLTPPVIASHISSNLRLLLRSHDICDYKRKIADTILESSLSLFFSGWTDAWTDGENKCALFTFLELPLLIADNKVKHCRFEIILNVTTRSLIHASLDGDPVVPADAYTLLLYTWGFIVHPKIHSYTCFAVNTTPDSFSLTERLSITSIMLNHFGYTWFPYAARLWSFLGLMNYHTNFHSVFDTTLAQGFHFHSTASQLIPFSRFLAFMFRARPIFLQEFELCRRQGHLIGIDPEALFLSSVVHSVDHSSSEKYTYDENWVKPSEDRFALVGSYVRLMLQFASDIPGPAVANTRCRDSSHPLFLKFYLRVVLIDKWMADRMDTCIAK